MVYLNNFYFYWMTKLKTYQLGISKVFLKGHPKAGTPTWFREKILCAIMEHDAFFFFSHEYLEAHETTEKKIPAPKYHTCRANYAYWKKIVDNINAGIGVLSLRQWEGKPYNSAKPEFLNLTKVGIQRLRIEIKSDHELRYPVIYIDDHKIDALTLRDLALNDGLEDTYDLINWLGWRDFEGCIIHFLPNFKYTKRLIQ